MLRASSPVPGRDADLGPVGLASINGVSREREFREDLYGAVGAYPDSGATSSLAAEIVNAVVAAITAAMSATPGAWTDLAGDGQPRIADRNNRRDVARLSLASTPALPASGQICAVFVVDIVGFTRPDRDDDIRLYLHERLYEYLQKAFDDAGLGWAACFREDRGDGALIVMPPDVPVKYLLDPLPGRLRSLVRRHNHVSREAASMQLRAAVHIGPVDHDGHGFVGTDINFAFRMLAARPFKRMLAASGAELGLVVSEYVYRSLVCRYPSLLPPDTFRTFRFQAKNTSARAWTYLPEVL